MTAQCGGCRFELFPWEGEESGLCQLCEEREMAAEEARWGPPEFSCRVVDGKFLCGPNPGYLAALGAVKVEWP